MNWIFIAFLEPVLFGLANVLDSTLINRFFKNAWVLTILAAFASAIFLPIVWLLDPPQMLPLGLLPITILVAFLQMFYGYPYYKALESDDTSVAISLFSLGKILVPVLGFLWIGEVLKPVQYVGFVLVTLSSAALTYNPNARFRFNNSFFYMLLSSVLFAVDAVLYKYIFENVSWGTGYFWVMMISALLGVVCLLPIVKRANVKLELRTLTKHYPLILVIGALGFAGELGFSYGIFSVPATVARSISSFQPFFVLFYAVLFIKFFPLVFKEKIDVRSLAKKVILFIVTVVGVIMTVG